MTVSRHEQLFEEPSIELPNTRLGEIVIACAERALKTSRKTTLPIEHKEIESYRSEIEAILQCCDYRGTNLVRGRRRSKKLHRNLVSAIHEILYHNPQFQGRFLLVLKEIRGQDKPFIPTRLSSISLKRRDLLLKDPGPDVYCVTKSVKPRKKKSRGRKPRF